MQCQIIRTSAQVQKLQMEGAEFDARASSKLELLNDLIAHPALDRVVDREREDHWPRHIVAVGATLQEEIDETVRIDLFG